MSACKDCRWYEPHHDAAGRCHFNPPVCEGTIEDAEDWRGKGFPIISPLDFCREFQEPEQRKGKPIVRAWALKWLADLLESDHRVLNIEPELREDAAYVIRMLIKGDKQ